jgi:hypothetical protein
MIRLSTLFWLVAVSTAGFAMFAVKYEVQSLADELAHTVKQADDTGRDIRVLDAEWAYLNRPDALAQMNQRFLSLAPIATKQLRANIVDLPMRPAPPPPPAPAPAPEMVAAAGPPATAATPVDAPAIDDGAPVEDGIVPVVAVVPSSQSADHAAPAESLSAPSEHPAARAALDTRAAAHAVRPVAVRTGPVKTAAVKPGAVRAGAREIPLHRPASLNALIALIAESQ